MIMLEETMVTLLTFSVNIVYGTLFLTIIS